MKNYILAGIAVSSFALASTMSFYDEVQTLAVCDLYNNEIQSCLWDSIKHCERVTDGHAHCGYYDLNALAVADTAK